MTIITRIVRVMKMTQLHDRVGGKLIPYSVILLIFFF